MCQAVLKQSNLFPGLAGFEKTKKIFRICANEYCKFLNISEKFVKDKMVFVDLKSYSALLSVRFRYWYILLLPCIKKNKVVMTEALIAIPCTLGLQAGHKIQGRSNKVLPCQMSVVTIQNFCDFLKIFLIFQSSKYFSFSINHQLSIHCFCVKYESLSLWLIW